MKKLPLIVLVLFVTPFLILLLTDKDPFEEPQELSREFNLAGKYVQQERVEKERETPESMIPEVDYEVFRRRDYILIEYLEEGNYKVSLHLDYQEVCTWDLGAVGPAERGEILYFANDPTNCPQIGEWNLVTWYVASNYGIYSSEGQFVQEIEVWTLKGGEYELLPIQ